jgi:phospholipase/carboxylesterase/glyoxalase family protein
MAELDFVHVYQPPPPPPAGLGADRSRTPTLLVLHGTGGSEHDLLSLASMLAPQFGVLSPRGKVLERGMPRFFRRLAEGVFDLDDLKFRTAELAAFVKSAAAQYGFDPTRVTAAGFSNGANIAASLLLLEPTALSSAILFRAMVPIVPDPLPALPGTPVFLANGRRDPLVPSAEAERLAALLQSAGADVTVFWQPGGHELMPGDVKQAREWLQRVPIAP